MKRYGLLPLAALALLPGSPSGVAQEAGEAPPPAAEERPAPPPAEDEPRTLEEIFIPSEEIGADEEVTFPIDI
jgi:hypothetical protein